MGCVVGKVLGSGRIVRRVEFTCFLVRGGFGVGGFRLYVFLSVFGVCCFVRFFGYFVYIVLFYMEFEVSVSFLVFWRRLVADRVVYF